VDTVYKIDGKVVEFLTGSKWLLDYEILALPLDDVIIVFEGHDPTINEKDIEKRIKNLPQNGVLHYDGNKVDAVLIKGVFLRENGVKNEVVESLGDGAVLKMVDGSLWSVPEYDQYDTSYWLPPYDVIIYTNELYIINLDEGKKIWINRIQ
jgi:hypothetical protein